MNPSILVSVCHWRLTIPHPLSVRNDYGVGQRYSVIVEANPLAPIQADGNYWIRTIVSDGCGTIIDNKPERGVIRYNPQSTSLPTSTNFTTLSTVCADMPAESITPVVAWEIDTQAVNDVLNNTFEADIDSISTHGAFRWDLTDTPLWYAIAETLELYRY